MSGNNVGADPADPVELDEHTDDDIVGVDGGGGLARRARAQRSLDQANIPAWNAGARARIAASQRGLSQARAAAWHATGRARSAAAPRNTAIPTEGTSDNATTGTVLDRVWAYRPHLLTAAAAVVGVLIVVLGRRAAARRADAVVDGADGAVIDAVEIDAVQIEVSAVPLNGEPLDN